LEKVTQNEAGLHPMDVLKLCPGVAHGLLRV
jgi:hypothetical protein